MKVKSAQELCEQNKLVKMYAGSIAYGTNLPTSDVDFRGIFCADPINVLTPFFPVREFDDSFEEDTKYYELSHFMKLCLECNPNIIELLWTSPEDITFRTPAYDLLRENRHKLLSSKIAFTTSGYAISQLKRIKGHNKWINNPQPVEPPRQIDFVSLVFNFMERKMFRKDFHLKDFHKDYRLIPYGDNTYGLYYAPGYSTFDDRFSLNTQYDEESDFHTIKYKYEWLHTLRAALAHEPTRRRRRPIAVVKFNAQEYNQAKENHKNYWTWKENRNATRSELEEKYGYDTKHAMHLVRLLRMGVEALRDGEIIVKRPDAEELLSIRAGAWTYDQIVAYAEQMDLEVREKWYKQTSLPKHPNIKFAAELLMEVQSKVWQTDSQS